MVGWVGEKMGGWLVCSKGLQESVRVIKINRNGSGSVRIQSRLDMGFQNH